MKLNIQWKKVLYGIALIVISIILAALHFIVAGKGIGYFTSSIIAVISVSTWDSSVSFPNSSDFGSCLSSRWSCIQCVRRKRHIVTVIQ